MVRATATVEEHDSISFCLVSLPKSHAIYYAILLSFFLLRHMTTGSYFVRRVCVEYAIDPQPDAKWKTVKAFSVLAPLLGGLGELPFIDLILNVFV